jgi:hypothetical protein
MPRINVALSIDFNLNTFFEIDVLNTQVKHKDELSVLQCQYKKLKTENDASTLNAFFSESTSTIFNMKICLEST